MKVIYVLLSVAGWAWLVIAGLLIWYRMRTMDDSPEGAEANCQGREPLE